jgi:GNAT superfamily N-acetyltransferase
MQGYLKGSKKQNFQNGFRIMVRFAGLRKVKMIEIRRATKAEVNVIAGFQKMMALETEKVRLSDNSVTHGVEAVIDDPAKGFYLVASEDSQVVACMMLTPEWSDWRNGYFLWIQSLYVIPEYRGRGVFSKMYSFIRDFVITSREYHGLRLYVVNSNIRAQEVYSHVGMDGNHYRMFEWVK